MEDNLTDLHSKRTSALGFSPSPMGLPVPVPMGLVEVSLQAGLREDMRVDRISRSKGVYTASIWPRGKNAAFIAVFFFLDASQVEKINETVFEVLGSIYTGSIYIGSVFPRIHVNSRGAPT